jgi:hypothetical protein
LVHTKQKTVGHGRVSATGELQYWFHSLLKGLDRHRTFALRRTGPLVSHWRNFRFGSERRSRLARRVLAWRRLQRRWRLPGKRFAVSSPCSRSLIGASKCRQAASAFMPIAMRLWQIIQSEARPVGRTPHETRMLRAVSTRRRGASCAFESQSLSRQPQNETPAEGEVANPARGERPRTGRARPKRRCAGPGRFFPYRVGKN